MQDNKGSPGNTPLIHAQRLGEVLDISDLYIKYEGTNPTRTQKDRLAVLSVRRAVEEGYDTVVVGSCGNYGMAIAYYASLYGIRSIIYLPKQSHSPRLKQIEDVQGTKLRLIDGLYEESVETSKGDAITNGWFDANPGAHPELGLQAFSDIASEIYGSIGKFPDTVSVPVGNGTTLAGIYYGFKKIAAERHLQRTPKMIAASTDGGNPIIESFKNGYKGIRDFPKERIRESEINEPLVNFHSYDGELAFGALVESNGGAEYVSDGDLLKYKELVKRYHGIDVIPAAAASLAATAKLISGTKVPGIHVAVFTG